MGAQGVNEMTNPTNTPVQKTPITVPIGLAVITAIAIATAAWGAGFIGGTETSDVAGVPCLQMPLPWLQPAPPSGSGAVFT